MPSHGLNAMQNNPLELIRDVSGSLEDSTVRGKIERLEAVFKTLPQVDIPVVERYAGGIYAREIIIPADTFVTGRIYKDDHFDVMVYGDVTVSGEDGAKRLAGFHVFPGNQGKKRAGYAHAETKWITFCASPPMENGGYLDHLTCESFSELVYQLEDRRYIKEKEIQKAFETQESYRESDYPAFKRGYLVALGRESKKDVDQADYRAVLAEYGFDEKTARAQSENKSDQKAIDTDVEVRESEIEGEGIFATRKYEALEPVMPARVGTYRTQAGRYTNHSASPNACMVWDRGDILLVARRRIMPGDEITIDYRISLALQKERAA